MEEKENTFKSLLPSVSVRVTASNNNANNVKSTGSDGEMEFYVCKICGLTISSSDALNNHLLSLHVVKRSKNCFPCECHPCAEKFQTSALLVTHLRRDHTEQKFDSCCRCRKKFNSPYSVPTHHSSYPPSKIYCNLCVNELQNPKDKAVKVIEVKNNEGNASKSVPAVPLNTSHSSDSKIVSKVNNFGQDGGILVDKSIQKPSESVNTFFELFAKDLSTCHIIHDDQSESAGNESEMDDYICQICNLGFSSSDVLDDHLNSLHVVTCFSCGSCKEVFETLEMLMNHLRCHHTKQNTSVCSQCGRKFTCSLSASINRDSTELSKICCDRCMVESQNEKSHIVEVINKNTEEKSSESIFDVSPNTSPCGTDVNGFDSDDETDCYICQVCQHSLSSSDALNRHIRSSHVVKTGRGFSCSSCKKAYKWPSKLIIHLRRYHTVQKIYTCSQCGGKLPVCHSVPTHDRRNKPSQIYCRQCIMEPDSAKNEEDEDSENSNCSEDGDFLGTESIQEPSEVITEGNSGCDIADEKNNKSATSDAETHSYVCQICHHVLTSSESLNGHLRSSHVVKNHVVKSGRRCVSCGSCKKLYASSTRLINHLRRYHTVQKIYSCGECGEKLSVCHSVRTHDRRKEPSRIYCRRCIMGPENVEEVLENACSDDGDILVDKSIEENSDIVSKFVKITAKDISTLDIVDEDDKNVTSLNSGSGKPRERKFACGNCPKKFWKKADLIYHLKNICQVRFPCEICKKDYVSKVNLQRHLRIHCGIKPYLCETCGKAFGQKDTLKMHRRKHTGERPFACDICEQSFSYKDQMLRHRRFHTGEILDPKRMYQCNLCDKNYLSASALNQHQHKHKNRKFTCEYCGKEYSNRGGLSIHRRIHTGERPYSCKYCDKSFTNGTSLIYHERVHSGEKPHVCDTCGKRFTQKIHLNSHRRVHTGEKPYECDICRKVFSYRFILVSHRRLHTGERPFRCDVCQKGFPDKGQLTKHQRTHEKHRN